MSGGTSDTQQAPARRSRIALVLGLNGGSAGGTYFLWRGLASGLFFLLIAAADRSLPIAGLAAILILWSLMRLYVRQTNREF
jgi:hypothetical protein